MQEEKPQSVENAAEPLPSESSEVGSTAHDAPPHMYTYKFATASSVYTAVQQLLAKQRHWKAVKGLRHNLLLGERWEVKYSQLGTTRGLNQCVNHIRGTKRITVKAMMVKTLRAHYSGSEGGEHPLSSFLPPTHLLIPGQGLGCERAAFLAECQVSDSDAQRPIWICKSTTGAHGKDIHISDDCHEILRYIDSFAPHDDDDRRPSSSEDVSSLQKAAAMAKRKRPAAWLVQRYISQPLLLRGRKFDIRALVCARGDGDVFWYSQGDEAENCRAPLQWILRTCSQPYSLADLGDKIAHISNHCIQTGSEDYSKHEEGNELFTEDLQRYLTESRGEADGAALFASIVSQMQEIVKTTMRSVSEVFDDGAAVFRSFQLLGYDFMVDAQCRVWLLEINGSPACAARLMPGFARAVVDVAINSVFPPPTEAQAAPPSSATTHRIDGEFQLIAQIGTSQEANRSVR